MVILFNLVYFNIFSIFTCRTKNIERIKLLIKYNLKFMFKRINSKKESFLFGFIFLLSWLPLSLISFVDSFIMAKDPNSGFGGFFAISILPAIVIISLAVLIFNVFIFIGFIRGSGLLILAYILLGIFVYNSISVVRPKALITSTKLLFSDMYNMDFYEKSKPVKTYADCEKFIIGPNVSSCANKVLSDSGDLMGCLQLSAKTADGYYVRSNWDNNGFNCNVSGNVKACEDFIVSPVKDSELYEPCVGGNSKSYDVSTLNSLDLNQIISSYDELYASQQKAYLYYRNLP